MIPALLVPDIEKVSVSVPLIAVKESVMRGIVIVVANAEGPLTTISGFTVIVSRTRVIDETESVTVIDSL